jgi:ribose transport system substrate-binding protein
MIRAAMPDGGTVALFIGSMASANAKARAGGVLDELSGQKDSPTIAGSQLGKYKLDDIHTDDTIETKAQDKAKDVLERLKGKPNVCLVGLYAYNPKAILLAARAKGQIGKVQIVGFDEDDLTLEGIEKGEIVGTVVQDPFNYGYKSVEVLAALKRGDSTKSVDGSVPYRIVTKTGGPSTVVNGMTIQNLKVSDFAAKLKADVASVHKK